MGNTTLKTGTECGTISDVIISATMQLQIGVCLVNLRNILVKYGRLLLQHPE